MWSARTPDAGDPDGIRQVAKQRGDFADRLADQALAELKNVISASADGAWTGEAATAFRVQAETIPGEVGTLISRLRREAEALTRYARAIDALVEDATDLRHREASARLSLHEAADRIRQADDPDATMSELQAGSHAQASVIQHQSLLSAAEREWERLADTRRVADAACEAEIAPPPPPIIATLGSSDLTQLSDQRLISMLTLLSPTRLIELLHTDPALAARIGAMHDAEAVAKWWDSLGDPQNPAIIGAGQLALVKLMPAQIGNLNGVAYWARDSANRAVLAAEISKLQGIEAMVENSDMPTGAQMDAVVTALKANGFETMMGLHGYLTSLLAIRSTLRSSADVPYQLVNFIQPKLTGMTNDGRAPLAAVSVGDMDTADNVTVAVPGMGTTVSSSMRSWTEDAANLYREQMSVERRSIDPAGNVAVVAWIGYDTPQMPPSLEVESLSKAKVGADSLAAFLGGVGSSRDWQNGSNLSVVAHSYGTTTASLALTKTPVENFTMLASAGLASNISAASDLMVPAGHVWASQASGDWVAPLGRLGDHPVNPADSNFGAHVFTSEDVVFQGTAYPGSDWHDASPQVTASLDHTQTYQYGYLDRGTISLLNTAKATLGVGGEATAKNTTAVPLSPEAQKMVDELNRSGQPYSLPANYGLPWGPGP